MESIKFSIAKEFSITPGPRYAVEGDHSGETFVNEFFERVFLDALEKKCKIIVNLDGTLGYGTSFLEEVFGGLTRKYGKERVLNTLDFVSNEEPYLIDDILEYIEDAAN